MWEIIGHDRPVQVLRDALSQNRVPQALVLAGPAGIGKSHLAMVLAQALNCTGPDVPCGRCVHCRQIVAGHHPDVVFIEPADGKDSIAIQQVRQLRDAASLRPFQGTTKVYVIAGAEGLTAQASDALLKTLEEPQSQVVIILTVVDADSLPSTVLSRCRVLPMQAVDGSTLERSLRERGIDNGEAPIIARLAQGNVGWALRASKQPKLVSQRSELLTRLCAIPDLDMADRLSLAETLASDRRDRSAVRGCLELLLLLGRDLMLVSLGQSARLATDAQVESLQRQTRRLSMREIQRYLQKIRQSMDRIDANVDARLVLESLLLGAP